MSKNRFNYLPRPISVKNNYKSLQKCKKLVDELELKQDSEIEHVHFIRRNNLVNLSKSSELNKTGVE